MIAIDAPWRRDNPLPDIGGGMDKDARGRVVLVGGSAFVPGALRLTGEAVLRVGAGKIQLATIAAAAIPLGMTMPEAAMIALPADDQGEIAGDAAASLLPRLCQCDTLVIGPGMAERPQTPDLVAAMLSAADAPATILLDAGAMTAARHLPTLGAHVVMTPHPGELATLMDIERNAVEVDPEAAATRAAARFGTVVVLKSAVTAIAAPDGTLLRYTSEAPGLGTAGSGDVLAGVIGGLLARGVAPLAAAGWGVWLHGEAGRAAARDIGPLGFLARELLRPIPALMAQG